MICLRILSWKGCWLISLEIFLICCLSTMVFMIIFGCFVFVILYWLGLVLMCLRSLLGWGACCDCEEILIFWKKSLSSVHIGMGLIGLLVFFLYLFCWKVFFGLMRRFGSSLMKRGRWVCLWTGRLGCSSLFSSLWRKDMREIVSDYLMFCFCCGYGIGRFFVKSWKLSCFFGRLVLLLC